MNRASQLSRSSPVLIVGAGPAGATAARRLALAGVPVRLLDRSAFPRNKPCGGGISMRVIRRFPYLEPALERIGTHHIARLHLEGPDGESTVVESDVPAALMIRRVEFDALLVSLAEEAGAELITGVDIVRAEQDEDGVTLVSRDGRRFDSPIVIAADGVHSMVARRLGLNPGWAATKLALDMMEETPRARLRDVDPSTLWVAYGYRPDADRGAVGQEGRERQEGRGRQRGTPPREVAEGYAYIFPKRDHVNIGVGYVLDYFREHVTSAPYPLQRAFIDRLRARGIVAGESAREHFTPFMLPVGGPLRVPGRGGLLLAGDAGGFVNGFTAEGIYYAMVSGELAATAIVETGHARETLVPAYAAACQAEIGPELRDAVLIQRYLFAHRARIRTVIDGARRERALVRLIVDFAVGRLSYRGLRRRMFARAPGLAVRLAWALLRQNA